MEKDKQNDQIQEACKIFKSMIEKLGKRNVVVVYGYTDPIDEETDEYHSGYASDNFFIRLGFLHYYLLAEEAKLKNHIDGTLE